MCFNGKAMDTALQCLYKRLWMKPDLHSSNESWDCKQGVLSFSKDTGQWQMIWFAFFRWIISYELHWILYQRWTQLSLKKRGASSPQSFAKIPASEKWLSFLGFLTWLCLHLVCFIFMYDVPHRMNHIRWMFLPETWCHDTRQRW